MSKKKYILTILFVLASLSVTALWAAGQKTAELNWLGENRPQTLMPVTWGVPWARGAHPKDASFKVTDSAGNPVDASSWPLAYWPDGSVKFTGLTIAAAAALQTPLTVTAGDYKPSKTLTN